MRRIRVSQTEFILDDKDYKALDNVVAIAQNILDEMNAQGYDYCEIEGEKWASTFLEDLIKDLRAIYEGQITLK